MIGGRAATWTSLLATLALGCGGGTTGPAPADQDAVTEATDTDAAEGDTTPATDDPDTLSDVDGPGTEPDTDDGDASDDADGEVDCGPELVCWPAWSTTCDGNGGYTICGIGTDGCPFVSEPVTCQAGNACVAEQDGLCEGDCIVPTVMLLLDRTAAMAGQKWEYTQAALTQVISESAGAVRFGIRVFPSAQDQCTPGNPVPPALDNATEVLDELVGFAEATTGPIYDTILSLPELLGDPEQGQHAILITGGAELCTDQGSILEELSAMRARGTKVHIVGMGPGFDPDLLDQMASKAATWPAHKTTNDNAMIDVLRSILGKTGVCCLDKDKDGYGAFCDQGLDCNDSDKDHHAPSCQDKACGDDGCGGICGTCETIAGGENTCNDGACLLACNPDHHECDGTCASNVSTGSCGVSCVACSEPVNGVASCDGVACGVDCFEGFHECEGACVSDEATATCGGSCAPCATDPNGVAGCAEGACTLTCDDGYALCDDACAPCPTGPGVSTTGCADGACVATECNAGFIACDEGCCDKLIFTIDTSASPDGPFGGWPSLGLSAVGQVHIAYHKRAGTYDGQVRYATGTPPAKLAVSKLAETTYGDHGRYTRLVVDTLGAVHVAYRGGPKLSDPELTHALKTAEGWEIEALADEGSLWDYQATDFTLAISKAGAPAAVYPSTIRLSYAYQVGFALEKTSIAQVEGQKYTDTPVALVGEDGLTHVFYLEYANTKKHLSYAVGGATTWTTEILDPSIKNLGLGRFGAAFDPAGQPTVCYFDNDPVAYQGMRFARPGDAGWDIDEVDTDAEQACSVAWSKDGLPVIVYRSKKGALRIATGALAGGWETAELLEAPEGVGKYGYRWPSMALGKDGTLHVAYWEQDTGAISYLFKPLLD